MSKSAYELSFEKDILPSINHLEVIAKQIVEGFMTGIHQSPFHGFSVEFAQHRPYMSGDNLRDIDWKVYARSDRYYIKQYEEETNLRSTILLDISASMNFSSGAYTKFEYATVLSSALAYLMLKQRDATGITLFDNQIRKQLPQKSVPSYLKEISKLLEEAQPSSETDISLALHAVAKNHKRRGLIVVISDLLDAEQDAIIKGMQHLKYNSHDVIVFQILDKQEMDFNYKGSYLFEDMETQEKIKTETRYIHQAYQEGFKAHQAKYKKAFFNYQIDFIPLSTSTPIETALNAYLTKRKKIL